MFLTFCYFSCRVLFASSPLPLCPTEERTHMHACWCRSSRYGNFPCAQAHTTRAWRRYLGMCRCKCNGGHACDITRGGHACDITTPSFWNSGAGKLSPPLRLSFKLVGLALAELVVTRGHDDRGRRENMLTHFVMCLSYILKTTKKHTFSNKNNRLRRARWC